MIQRSLVVLGLALSMSLLSTVQAEEIAVANASFETVVGDPLGPGGWTNDLPGWSGPTNAGDSFIEYIDAFSADGTNHLGMAAGAEVSQDLGVGLMPNMTYTLSVAVGRRNASFTVDGNDSRFGLYLGGDAADGGSMLAEGSYSAFPLTDLTFVDQSVSFTTGDSVAAGNLFISLRSAGPDRAHFDDVRLSVVPEPATMGMVLVGLLGLAATRRRR